MLPKSERLGKVKANMGMLLLPAEHCTCGSLEKCHSAIAITMYCQLEGSILDVGEVITLPGYRENKWSIVSHHFH